MQDEYSSIDLIHVIDECLKCAHGYQLILMNYNNLALIYSHIQPHFLIKTASHVSSSSSYLRVNEELTQIQTQHWHFL